MICSACGAPLCSTIIKKNLPFFFGVCIVSLACPSILNLFMTSHNVHILQCRVYCVGYNNRCVPLFSLLYQAITQQRMHERMRRVPMICVCTNPSRFENSLSVWHGENGYGFLGCVNGNLWILSGIWFESNKKKNMWNFLNKIFIIRILKNNFYSYIKNHNTKIYDILNSLIYFQLARFSLSPVSSTRQ